MHVIDSRHHLLAAFIIVKMQILVKKKITFKFIFPNGNDDFIFAYVCRNKKLEKRSKYFQGLFLNCVAPKNVPAFPQTEKKVILKKQTQNLRKQ